MTKRKRLAWYDTELGPTPDCGPCLDTFLSPLFAEAVYSVSIEHPGNPADLARRTIEHYHERKHVDE
jgi:hypothetical protein